MIQSKFYLSLGSKLIADIMDKTNVTELKDVLKQIPNKEITQSVSAVVGMFEFTDIRYYLINFSYIKENLSQAWENLCEQFTDVSWKV